jgi:hypothetical protein
LLLAKVQSTHNSRTSLRRYYASATLAYGEWLWLDLGTSVPVSDIAYYFHGNNNNDRPTALQCYMVLWKDSSNTTIVSHHFKGNSVTHYLDPAVPDWPPTAPNPGALRSAQRRLRAV